MIDIQKEIDKLQDKKSKLNAHLGKLREAADKPDYAQKVPENVRQQNQQKVGHDMQCYYSFVFSTNQILP